MTQTMFDYVIVGAGAAGCAMAFRLSEDPGIQVLLLEAGPSNSHPFIHMPKAIGKALSRLELIWPYMTEPVADTNGAPEVWARGKTLGGSTSLNGMMYVRGQPADYEEMARTVGPEWGWSHIGGAYRAMESHELGVAETRGVDGPLRISMPTMKNALTEALVEAGVAMGLPRKSDVNAPDNGEGVGYAPRTVHRGRRESAATAFLEPIRKRPNLVVKTGVLVDRLLFEQRRAVAVVASVKGSSVTYRAKREIHLAAGALASPALLQRSGIGPADHLRSVGVELLHHSPNVGRNMREHRAMVMQWKARDELSSNAGHMGARLAANVGRYYLKKDGLMAAATYEIGAWFNTRPGLDRPDGQFLIAPYSFDYSKTVMAIEPFGGMQICAYYLRPESSGSLLIRSGNPNDHPIIRPNYHGEPADREAMIKVARTAREYVRQRPLEGMVFEETRPGADYNSDDEIIAAYDKFGNGAYHASGTCRAGADEEAVVDSRLRVRGVDGLRVIDTSILPFLVAGNTGGPAMVTAWRAADLVIEDNTVARG
jgi:choline dehydrogenase